jgi:pimeloyl-ACP methyl ester carboxylesterase
LIYRVLLADQFDYAALIGSIGGPVMILHGTADSSVPTSGPIVEETPGLRIIRTPSCA